MHLVKLAELDVVLQGTPVEGALVSQLKDGGWVLTIRVKNRRTQLLEDYQLKTARGEKKVWSEPSTIFRLLKDRYYVRTGVFQL